VLQVGAASADITPDSGLPHYYGGSLERVPGLDLSCHAVCMTCGDSQAALVSVDATFLDRALVLLMRERAELACGVPAGNICIAATTLTAPAGPADSVSEAGDIITERSVALLRRRGAACLGRERAGLGPTPGGGLRRNAGLVPQPDFLPVRRRPDRQVGSGRGLRRGDDHSGDGPPRDACGRRGPVAEDDRGGA